MTVTGLEPLKTVERPTGARALWASVRAEMLRLRMWPAVWVLAGVWLALNLTFAYVFDYIAYTTGSGSFGGAQATMPCWPTCCRTRYRGPSPGNCRCSAGRS